VGPSWELPLVLLPVGIWRPQACLSVCLWIPQDLASAGLSVCLDPAGPGAHRPVWLSGSRRTRRRRACLSIWIPQDPASAGLSVCLDPAPTGLSVCLSVWISQDLALAGLFGRTLPPWEQAFVVVTDSVMKQLDGLKKDPTLCRHIRRFLGHGLDTYGPAGPRPAGEADETLQGSPDAVCPGEGPSRFCLSAF
jgi:hypothetical protein